MRLIMYNQPYLFGKAAPPRDKDGKEEWIRRKGNLVSGAGTDENIAQGGVHGEWTAEPAHMLTVLRDPSAGRAERARL